MAVNQLRAGMESGVPVKLGDHVIRVSTLIDGSWRHSSEKHKPTGPYRALVSTAPRSTRAALLRRVHALLIDRAEDIASLKDSRGELVRTQDTVLISAEDGSIIEGVYENPFGLQCGIFTGSVTTALDAANVCGPAASLSMTARPGVRTTFHMAGSRTVASAAKARDMPFAI
jgi:hypothetical protein